MTRYLLDTNIVSDATKLAPAEALVDWLGRQADEDLFLSALTIAEIWRGILEKTPGRKRRELETWFGGPEGPHALARGQVPEGQQGPQAFRPFVVSGLLHRLPAAGVDLAE